jgi:WD40 repeat protein
MKIATTISVILFVLLNLTARGQIFITNYNDNTVANYEGTTGTPINNSFISGLTNPQGLAVSGSSLFVANNNIGRIGKYDTNSGTAINTAFIGGLSTVMALATKGDSLFVSSGSAVKRYELSSGTLLASGGTGLVSFWGLAVADASAYATAGDTIVKFDSASLSVTNASFITGLTQAAGVAAANGFLYVANSGSNTIGKYDAITGTAINTSFITGGALAQPTSLSIYGGNLFVINQTSRSLAIYDLATGGTVNSSFITGLTQPTGMTVMTAVPETSTYAAILGVCALSWAMLWQRRHRRGT